MKTFVVQVILLVVVAAVAVMSTPQGKYTKKPSTTSIVEKEGETEQAPVVYRVKRNPPPAIIQPRCPPCSCPGTGGGWGAGNPKHRSRRNALPPRTIIQPGCPPCNCAPIQPICPPCVCPGTGGGWGAGNPKHRSRRNSPPVIIQPRCPPCSCPGTGGGWGAGNPNKG